MYYDKPFRMITGSKKNKPDWHSMGYESHTSATLKNPIKGNPFERKIQNICYNKRKQYEQISVKKDSLVYFKFITAAHYLHVSKRDFVKIIVSLFHGS